MNILKNKKCNIKINDEEIETLTRWQDPVIKDLEQELERYKNIIDELEEWLTKNISQINVYFDNTPFGVEDTYKEVLNKLKELKEGSDR